MNHKKYLMIFGTRPEAIKLHPVWREMNKFGLLVQSLTLDQSHDLLPETLKELQWSPSHVWYGESPEDLIWGAEMTIEETQPDYVIVQGDTRSAWAGAQSAHFAGIPVIHIEAGIRSGNLHSPWPEEGIRRQIDAVSSVMFCASEKAYTDLMLTTDTLGSSIHLVGNTGLVDVDKICRFPMPVTPSSFCGILITLHRKELDELEAKAVIDAAYRINLPVRIISHPNKKVIGTTPPMTRADTIRQVASSKLVITDSGGLQEECEYLGKRCLVARHSPDRGFSPVIRFFNVDMIEEDIYNVLASTPRRDSFDHANSAKRIAQILYDRDYKPCKEDRARA